MTTRTKIIHIDIEQILLQFIPGFYQFISFKLIPVIIFKIQQRNKLISNHVGKESKSKTAGIY